MSAGAILRAKKLTGAGIVRLAAAHNKRAIQAELSAGGSIDVRRSGLNECLAGPVTPEHVADYAKVKMAEAGVGKLRKDAVRALEFVVSLAPGQCATERQFFADALSWLAERFGGDENVLSADVHHDEASPHLHVLILPLVDGRMRGSEAVGGPSQLQKLQADFFEAVCISHGLKRYPRRLSRADKATVSSAVLAELKRRADPVVGSALWPVVRDRIESDPGPSATALGLDLSSVSKPKKLRSMTAIFTSKGKGDAKPDPESNLFGYGSHQPYEAYALYGLYGS